MADRSSVALPPPSRATAMIVIGMAGSGKSTFVAKLAAELARRASATAAESQGAGVAGTPPAGGEPSAEGGSARAASPGHVDPPPRGATRPYIINIDPAVATLGYTPNVDIRDTIDYRRVMEDYKLGPNGGIVTALNLFTTKFDQVLDIVDKRASAVEYEHAGECSRGSYVVLDTPGQIEVFTWSASGQIITDALASAMPTVLVYVVDTPRTTAPATFMSNMLYACSILYKSGLPFILVFNKIDVQSYAFAQEWMHDFESFQKALATGNAHDPSVHSTGAMDEDVPDRRTQSTEPSFLNSLMNSMSLVLDEFYKNLRAVGVSSTTGEGIDAFLDAVQDARQEYLSEYRPALERTLAKKQEEQDVSKNEQLTRLARDMSARESRTGLARVRATARADPDAGDGPQYAGDGELVDPDSDEEKLPYGVPGGDDRVAKRWNQHDGSYWPTPP
ncbi:hypothetical protein MSPP1_003609 [Malassezia sp. CBS 17886]|nr:hypothetical protein MSPP1_003609 [Malassezia sp. CBS 17886]